MSTEALKKLAGVFQEKTQELSEKNIHDHELGGELWYE